MLIASERNSGLYCRTRIDSVADVIKLMFSSVFHLVIVC